MRLIDAEALVEHAGLLYEKMGARGGGKSILTLAKIWLLNEVENAPTIEAKPVVHAHWNADGRCTNCGGHAPFFAWTDEWFGTKFCPHCGAQMNFSEEKDE